MKRLQDMTKKELKKLSDEKIKELALKEINEILKDDPILSGGSVEVNFNQKQNPK
jgi:hypothetical protein